MILARSVLSSLFILAIMLEMPTNVKPNYAWDARYYVTYTANYAMVR
jgi:hypothetical protein